MGNVSVKNNNLLEQAAKHWKYLAPVLMYPKNESEYEKLVARLDQLLDIVGENEKHPLIGMVDMVSHIVESYEDQHLPAVQGTGVDALKYLMELHHLNQADLVEEIGGQGVVSEILNGKRELNVRQIKALAKRFNVEASTFID